MNQILLNIVGNAVKFTPAGGTINIRVMEKPCPRSGCTTYVFSVKDNGIGMSQEFQQHVFDSFARKQTVTRSGIQGTGLGMAITKNIVDMMGGTITLKSEQGKGSEFTVTLDCKISKTQTKSQPIPELRGARALVVDDDAQTCMSVSKMLRQIEMTADWTTSGKEAILRAQEAHEQGRDFKAYIIDWLMPDMNGIETVRRIRKVIGVVSGKGGVGKSMTSAMLAVSMRRLGYKAGVLDADITGPSIPRLFGVKGPATGDGESINPVCSRTGVEILSLIHI